MQSPRTDQIFTTYSIAELLHGKPTAANLKATERAIQLSAICFKPLSETSLIDEHNRRAKCLVINHVVATARRKRKLILFAQLLTTEDNQKFFVLNDARKGRRWFYLDPGLIELEALQEGLIALLKFESKDIIVIPSGPLVATFRHLVKRHRSQRVVEQDQGSITIALEAYSHSQTEILQTAITSDRARPDNEITHLDRLEAESIHIIREMVGEAVNPVMLYSMGKDSSVMLHLALKAFYPSLPPFPLLHVDTLWKFQAVYDFRDYMTKESGMDMLVHVNPDGVAKNINPFDHGSALHTDIMKNQSLKMALDHYQFDLAFGGSRRDEEKSRATERILSFRNSLHRWEPKNQRPELWNLYNGKKNKGETIQVFPVSNWTEFDIWQYIYREQILIVPLYFASERPVINRDGMLIMVDDDRLPLHPNDTIQLKKVRFRTLGCYPLTGAIESEADDMASIMLELSGQDRSERQGRVTDTKSEASMEKKKQNGYF